MKSLIILLLFGIVLIQGVTCDHHQRHGSHLSFLQKFIPNSEATCEMITPDLQRLADWTIGTKNHDWNFAEFEAIKDQGPFTYLLENPESRTSGANNQRKRAHELIYDAMRRSLNPRFIQESNTHGHDARVKRLSELSAWATTLNNAYGTVAMSVLERLPAVQGELPRLYIAPKNPNSDAQMALDWPNFAAALGGNQPQNPSQRLQNLLPAIETWRNEQDNINWLATINFVNPVILPKLPANQHLHAEWMIVEFLAAQSQLNPPVTYRDGGTGGNVVVVGTALPACPKCTRAYQEYNSGAGRLYSFVFSQDQTADRVWRWQRPAGISEDWLGPCVAKLRMITSDQLVTDAVEYLEKQNSPHGFFPHEG